jgi:hypothetical protein
MSQKSSINFYLKKQKKSKARISDVLSGRARKSSAKKGKASTPAASTPAVGASTSTAASTSATPSFVRRGESEMEDVIIESTTTPFTIGSDEESQPTRASKRRRTNTGSEEQHSDGNFQKISKNLIKIFYNI